MLLLKKEDGKMISAEKKKEIGRNVGWAMSTAREAVKHFEITDVSNGGRCSADSLNIGTAILAGKLLELLFSKP